MSDERQPRVRRFGGDIAPLIGRAGEAPAIAPSAASTAEIMCELRLDAKRLLRASMDLAAQNASAVRLLATINDRMEDQTNDAERMLEAANANTDRVVEAIDRLCAALQRNE